ncbi:MAG: FtsX-like permease family protein, partial [Bryobacteraceae bacterium]
RQFLAETVALSAIGGAAGLLLATWGLTALQAAGQSFLPQFEATALDPGVLAFTLALSIGTGILFGLAPALAASKTDLHDSLKEGGRGFAGRAAGRRLRSGLVVAQVALAFVLVIGAGLLIRSLGRLLRADPGFRPSSFTTAAVQLPAARYSSPAARAAFATQLVDRLRSISGVGAVTFGVTLPLSGVSGNLSFAIAGRPAPPDDGSSPAADINAVEPAFFSTLGIPLRAGRHFSSADTAAGPAVAIVSEATARRYFPGENPVGQRIQLFGTREIVGIASDAQYHDWKTDRPPMIYLPYDARFAPSRVTVVVGAERDAAALLRREVRALDPSLPLFNVRTMDEIVALSVARPRFEMTLLTAFAALALVLAAVGVYGVISHYVTQRTREIGVRMALGATRADIRRLVLRQGLGLAAGGIALGVAVSIPFTRLLGALLYQTAPADPLTYSTVALVLVAAALAAAYLPARRASIVDPIVALRQE